jgi:hypothetical protein
MENWRRYLKEEEGSFIFESTTSNLKELNPNDWLTVYHGTYLAQIFNLINGFDAIQVKTRSYGGPKHRGLFVAPDLKTARSFASYNPVVLEMVVKARNLHGTNYSGVTGRDKPENEKIWKSYFPRSFRPYLSQTLTQKTEPQALLMGLVSPKQIKRIWYKDHWYSRKDFLDLGIEAIPAKKAPYGRMETIKDYEVDLSYPGYSYKEFLNAISILLHEKRNPSQIKNILSRYADISVIPGRGDTLQEIIEDLGFQPLAAKTYANRFRERLLSKSPFGESI